VRDEEKLALLQEFLKQGGLGLTNWMCDKFRGLLK